MAIVVSPPAVRSVVCGLFSRAGIDAIGNLAALVDWPQRQLRDAARVPRHIGDVPPQAGA
jgi:hypothetical protein